MPIAHLLELWKGIEVEPMETETVVEDAALDEEPVKEEFLYRRQIGASKPHESFLLICGCCQAHDNCYSKALKMESCKFLLDNPYTKLYDYSCSNEQVTCSSKNKDCAAFICNCDRTAATCFARAPYNPENKNLDTDKYCK